jgi:hypothetical protein
MWQLTNQTLCCSVAWAMLSDAQVAHTGAFPRLNQARRLSFQLISSQQMHEESNESHC